MIETVGSLAQSAGLNEVNGVVVQTGVRPGRVTLEVHDGDVAKMHLSPERARDLAVHLITAARKAGTTKEKNR